MTTVVLAYAPDGFVPDRQVQEMARRLAVPSTTVVVPAAPTHRSLLQRWLEGCATSREDDIWLVDAAFPPEAGDLEQMRRGLAHADGVFGRGHVFVRREALEQCAEAWRARDPLVGGCLEQLWEVLRESGYRPLSLEDATPRIVPPEAVGEAAVMDGPVKSHVLKGHNAEIVIGRHTYAHAPSRILAYDHTTIRIGAFCSIAPEVLLCNPASTGVRLRAEDGRPLPTRLTRFAAGHHPETAALYPLSGTIRPDPGCYATPGPGSHLARPLVIGNDVWIGAAAKIVGGFTIGDGAIISVGSVVMGDVPPFAVVMGNPATVVRSRFSPAVVEQLLRIRWWDWPDEVIATRATWFQNPITEFVDRFGTEAEDAA